MADGDIKGYALNSTHDFYELLDLPTTANDSEIRRAYRKTALKYHPDKVGADQSKLDKFHLLQIANDVLLDSTVRQLYDNARRAREENERRQAAYSGRRKHLIEELERKENAGLAGLKRARAETVEEEAFQRELKRLATDGARRRKEREDQLRREYEEHAATDSNEIEVLKEAEPISTVSKGVEDIERTIKLRYPSTAGVDEPRLRSQFGRFGSIQDVVTREKKIKLEGAKHRKNYTIAMIVFESIVGAHAAITDVPDLAKKESSWAEFEGPTWAGGTEPDCVSKLKEPSVRTMPDSDRDVPFFGSFKSAMKAPAGATMEEYTIMRLKNAERKRLAEKLRQEEEEEETSISKG